MRRRALVIAVMAGIVVFGVASPAVAKGPDRATITGPGLTQPIVVGGNGEPGSGEQLATLAEGSGFFSYVFGGDSGTGKRLLRAPGALGPKYEITWRVPDGSATGSVVHQDLYPTAKDGPITFTPSGQRVFDTGITGGWYQTPVGFGALLVALKVPDAGGASAAVTPAQSTPPTQNTSQDVAGHTSRWPAVAGIVIAAVILVGGAITMGRRRGVIPR